MRIRHLVAADNVGAQGYVIDPLLVRHGIVLGAQIADLAEAAAMGETMDWRDIGGFAPRIELMQFQHA